MSTKDNQDNNIENYDPDEMEKILKEVKQEAYTNILDNLKFENKLDEMVFNLLPLSKKQKEELVMECSVSDDIKEHYEKIKKLKAEEDKKKSRVLDASACSSNKDDTSFYTMMESIKDDLTDEE